MAVFMTIGLLPVISAHAYEGQVFTTDGITYKVLTEIGNTGTVQVGDEEQQAIFMTIGSLPGMSVPSAATERLWDDGAANRDFVNQTSHQNAASKLSNFFEVPIYHGENPTMLEVFSQDGHMEMVEVPEDSFAQPPSDFPSPPSPNFNGDDGVTNWDFINPVTHLKSVPEGYIGIYTAQELDNIRNNLRGNYILMNDIDLASWGNWTPIGSDYSSPYMGIFDGNGYAVKNLTINAISSDIEYVGLFGYTMSLITNVCLIDTKITITSTAASSNIYAGNIAGFGYPGSVINNCTVRF